MPLSLVSITGNKPKQKVSLLEHFLEELNTASAEFFRTVTPVNLGKALGRNDKIN